MIKNSKILALKQAVAFSIDLMLVSLPFIVAPSIEILPLISLLWLLYIPLSEYYFSQTLGMNLVGTYIFASLDGDTYISLKTASRRQIARISFMWGALGWVFLFLGKQYGNDYIVSDGKNYSLDENEDAFIIIYQNNEWKVIFFVFAMITLFSIVYDN